MRLVRAEINNFRTIADVTIPLEPSCRVLVGVNESGKSNILRALALLDAQRQPKSEDLREFGPDESPDDPAFVRFVFRLDPNEKAKVFEKLSAKIFDGGSHPIIKMEERELTFREFCDWKQEVIYEVDIRTKERELSHWALPGKPQLCQGWLKPKPTQTGNPSLPLGGKPVSSYSFVHSNNLETGAENL